MTDQVAQLKLKLDTETSSLRLQVGNWEGEEGRERGGKEGEGTNGGRGEERGGREGEGGEERKVE